VKVKLDGRLLAEALVELKGWYSGFRWESELWANHGHRRSPYRVLVLFGLSPRTKDTGLVEMCRAFFQRFPHAEVLASMDNGDAGVSTAADGIVRKRADTLHEILGAAIC
jgi:endonuclease III